MLKRIHLYFKEQYPIIPRLFLGAILFFEIYFIILLNFGYTEFKINHQELIGAFTCFAFLMLLRIADDFKDYETDKILFPHRTLPSGQVKHKDLILVLSLITALTVALNFLFMNNVAFFVLLYTYGFLMAMWFFQKHKIQPNLLIALVTHNPVQMILNVYIISFTLIKYRLPLFRLHVILMAFTLYFPALIWEVARKIRAPEDETEYVTYSKLFGVKKSIRFITLLTWVDIATNIYLVWHLNQISALILFFASSWMTLQFVRYVKDPNRFKIVDQVLRYTYVQESVMLLTVASYLLWGYVGL